VNKYIYNQTQWAKSPKSAMLSKIHSYRLLFGDLAHWGAER